MSRRLGRRRRLPNRANIPCEGVVSIWLSGYVLLCRCMKLDDFKRTSFVFHSIYVPRSSQVLGDTSLCVHFRGLLTGGVKNNFMQRSESRGRNPLPGPGTNSYALLQEEL